ncbi:MAG TPA: hypothetical protein VMF30_05540, partial [Pirellulales bacterium]|nr:hypothetical protein [Pirellulales bacterium]
MKRFSLVAIFVIAAITLIAAAHTARADGPGDNLADKVRPVPPPGIEVPAEDAKRLEEALAKLDSRIAELREKLRDKPARLAELPDVEIYAKAVRWALQYHEFFNPAEIATADKLLARGQEQAERLAKGERLGANEKAETRTVRVHAYRSKIDGSLQPYKIVIPPGYDSTSERPRRLDFWCHGRG